MITAGSVAIAALPSSASTPHPTTGAQRRPITIRSTRMSHHLHEELARAHLERRLHEAERQRLAAYVVRLAKARRASRRAERAAEQAQLRLRLLAG